MNVGTGDTVLLTSSMVSATDVDDASASLVFTVTNVQYGQFERIDSPGVPISSFDQGQVAAGMIQFVHDGSENAPSFDVTVGDGSLSDGPQSASINFTAVAISVDEDPDPAPEEEPTADSPVSDPEPAAEEAVLEESLDGPVVSNASDSPTGGRPGRVWQSLVLPRTQNDPDTRTPGPTGAHSENREHDHRETITPSISQDLVGLNDQAVWEILDRMRQEMRDDAAQIAAEDDFRIVSAEGIALGASTMLLATLMRSSSLLAVALSSLPLWRRVDPLAVLALSEREREERERELRAARKAEDENAAGVGELLDDEGDE